MRLRQCKYFIGIVEHGGFTKAAERLFVAQSALSLQMKKLEEEFGTPLFVRNSNGVTLTAAGELFLRHARTITEQVGTCDQEIRSLTGQGAQGLVRIGIAVSLSRVLTIPLLHSAKVTYPNISLHVIEALTADMERGLDDGSLDLAIGFGWNHAMHSSNDPFDNEVLRTESLYLVSPADDDGACVSSIDLAELQHYDLVMPTQRYATRRFINEETARRGIAINVRYELDSLQQALSMVIQGEAHSIMSMSTFLPEWQAAEVRARLITGWSRSPQLCIRSTKKGPNALAAKIRQLVHTTADQLADQGKWPRLLDDSLFQSAVAEI